MGNPGSLRLTLVDLPGEPIGETGDVKLHNQTITDEKEARFVASGLLMSDLQAFPHGLYEVNVFPATYKPESRFVNSSPDKPAELCVVFHKHDQPNQFREGHFCAGANSTWIPVHDSFFVSAPANHT